MSQSDGWNLRLLNRFAPTLSTRAEKMKSVLFLFTTLVAAGLAARSDAVVTVKWCTCNETFLSDSGGSADDSFQLASGDLLEIGTWASPPSSITPGNLATELASFEVFATGSINEGPGTFMTNSQTAVSSMFTDKQIYMVAFNGPTQTSARQVAIFYMNMANNPAWQFPADGNSTSIDPQDLFGSNVTGRLTTGAAVLWGSPDFDPAGYNLIDTSTFTFLANFTAAPTNGVLPLTVRFTDDSVGSVTNWSWIFGDGTATNVTTATVSHTYVAGGNDTVTEIVRGPAGVSTNIQTNCITVEWPPPSADFNAAPTAGVAPLAVTFTDTSTGGPITLWSWNFGDGTATNVTTATVSHTYTIAGNFSVTETASGPGGSSQKTRPNSITVLSPLEGAQFQAWLTAYLKCTSCVQSSMTADADGTGQNNFFKYTAGLDPTNPGSVFVVSPASVENVSGQFTFQFSPVVAGRLYTPQFCTNLVSGAWFPLANYSGPTTNATVATITDLDPIRPNEFYRISISLQPFAITSITRTGQNVSLAWNGQPGTNVVQVTNGSFSTNFSDLATVILPGYAPTNYTDTGAATNFPSRFYRIDYRY
jgi:PKD repeat protein